MKIALEISELAFWIIAILVALMNLRYHLMRYERRIVQTKYSDGSISFEVQRPSFGLWGWMTEPERMDIKSEKEAREIAAELSRTQKVEPERSVLETYRKGKIKYSSTYRMRY